MYVNILRLGSLIIMIIVIGIYIYGNNEKGNREPRNWQRGQIITEKNILPAPRVVENIAIDNYSVMGKTYTTYQAAPNRVVVVGENRIETLLALGLENNIVAAVTENTSLENIKKHYQYDYPQLPLLNSTFLNVESILAVNPDLIITQQCHYIDKRLRSTNFWHSRGINTFVPLTTNAPLKRIYRESVEQEYEFILGLGQIFGVEARAIELVEKMQAEINYIREQTKNQQQPTVLIVEFYSGRLISYDSSKLAGNMCANLGAKVIDTPQATMGLEDLFMVDPDVLFVVQSGGNVDDGLRQILNNVALRNLRCIKNKRAYSISLNETYNSAIKTISGIRTFARGLYPELILSDN